MTEFEQLILSKLEYIDRKIDDRFNETNERLNNHMEDEEGKIEIMSDRFTHMQRSVDSFTTGVNGLITEVQQAFLEHPEEKGKRDYVGHYHDHKTRKRWYDRWTGWVEAGFGNIVKVVMASGTAWLFYEIWSHLLKGPK